MTSGVGVDVGVGEVTSSKHGHTFADLACCGRGRGGRTWKGGGRGKGGWRSEKASVVLVTCVK